MSDKEKVRVRVPSLQHFSALLGGTAESIEKRLLAVLNLPVSYLQLREQLTIDLINLHVSPEQVVAACEKLKGDLNRASNLKALYALMQFIEEYRPSKLLMVEKRYFPIGRGLRVPVNPLGVIYLDDVPHLFWLSLWKYNRFDSLTGAVFGTILERTFFASRDFREMPPELL